MAGVRRWLAKLRAKSSTSFERLAGGMAVGEQSTCAVHASCQVGAQLPALLLVFVLLICPVQQGGVSCKRVMAFQ
jgi:hypothetical protein